MSTKNAAILEADKLDSDLMRQAWHALGERVGTIEQSIARMEKSVTDALKAMATHAGAQQIALADLVDAVREVRIMLRDLERKGAE